MLILITARLNFTSNFLFNFSYQWFFECFYGVSGRLASLHVKTGQRDFDTA